MKKGVKILFPFIFFWIFLTLFKFGGGLHYSLISPLGEKLLPLWFVGLLMSIASIIQLALDIPAGKMLDKFGYKKMLAVGTIVFIFASLLLYFNFNSLFLIASVLLAGLGWLFFGPGINAYALSHAEKGRSGKFMAFRDIFGSVGIVLASVALPFVIILQPKLIGIIIASLLFLSFLAIIFSPEDRRKITLEDHYHEKTHHQRRYLFLNFFSVLKRLNPPSSLLIGLNFVGALFYGVVWFVIPLVIAHTAENAKLLGIGLGMFDFAIVIVGSLLCTLVDKANKKRMIFIGLLLFSIGAVLLGSTYGLLFLVFAFLATSGDEVASLPLWAWLHKLDKKHNKDGLISGIINLSNDLGWAIGPLLAGLLYSLLGPKLTIVIGAIPIVIMLIIYHFAVRKHLVKISVLEAPRKPHKQRHKP